jgi:hypothetical protein
MVGLERSILPLLAEQEFGITSKTAAVSFIASFGLAKALSNLVAGRLAERFTRKGVLTAGWLFALPVPFMLIWAPAWSWVIGANVLLGINQGLAWSMTVNMKVDLAGPGRRGLALGLRPEPFYLGIGLAAAGLALSVLFVRDTGAFVALESSRRAPAPRTTLPRSFASTTWRRPQLMAVSQAGFVNNLNDGLAWGIFPLFFASKGLSVERVARCDVPVGLGVAPAPDGLGQRHRGAAGGDRLRHAAPGRRDRARRGERQLRRVGRRGRSARARDGAGLPDAAGRDRGPGAPGGARDVVRGLSLLAGRGAGRRRAGGRRRRRCVRLRGGDPGGRRAHGCVGPARGR